MTAETAGMDSQPACLPDGLTDDYEYGHGELPEVLRRDKMTLYVPDLQNFKRNCSHVLHRKCKTEAASAEICEAVTLVSGAWKT